MLTDADDPYEDYDIEDRCWYCDGTGTVTPTNTRVPANFLILNSETCPMCDGTGEDFV